MLSNVGLAEIKFYTIVNLLRFLQSHLYWIIARTITVLPVGARWPSGLERWTGDRMLLGSNPATATLTIPFARLCQCLSEETLKAVGSFCQGKSTIPPVCTGNV